MEKLDVKLLATSQSSLEKIQFSAKRVISASFLGYARQPEFLLAHELDRLVLTLRTTIHGEPSADPDIISYPENWIEAFKERFFPVWLRKIFPVKFVRHTIEHKVLYTNLALQDSHLRWCPYMVHKKEIV